MSKTNLHTVNSPWFELAIGMEKSSNCGEVRIMGSCNNVQIFTTKHGFWISVSAEEGMQGTVTP